MRNEAISATTMRQHGQPAWTTSHNHTAAAPHVLVCVSGSQDDLRLMRHGALLAGSLHARLTILYVLTPAGRPRPADVLGADRIFARSLGVALVEAPACSLLDGIAQYCAERAVTQIVLSEERRTPWYAVWHGSVVDGLVERLTNTEIYVLGDANLVSLGPP